jgi:hypothetical protein
MVMLEQVGDLQILMIDHIEMAHHMERGFVLEVLPLALHLLMRFGEQFQGLTPTVAALLPARATLRCAVFKRRSARR